MANWNQPICDPCWQFRCALEGTPGRKATRLKNAEFEDCAFCGKRTASGIYVREHPDLVPYPKQEVTPPPR